MKLRADHRDNSPFPKMSFALPPSLIVIESLSNHYEYDSDQGWRPIEPSAHAPVVIPLSLLDSTSVLVRWKSDLSYSDYVRALLPD